MSSVYLDTSAILPLLDEGDRDHARVKAALQALASDDTELVTSSYVLVETHALVRSRLGLAALRMLNRLVSESTTVVWVDEETHGQAWRQTLKGPRNGPSLVDWTSVLVMRNMGLSTVLGIDRHFREQGFRCCPETP
jgi:predicted nucleic acid-binding protein